jgi:hypothetical protein
MPKPRRDLLDTPNKERCAPFEGAGCRHLAPGVSTI